MDLQAPKGTRDLFGQDAEDFYALEQIAREVFSLYAFSEVRTPIFESAELFKRSLGDTSDVVEKEMFTFTDRGERSFALRPEGTAGVVRHFIEQNLAVKAGIHRLFYMGPMFRAERPQAGRYRQFFQIGSEFFGSGEANTDADTVLMVAEILNRFGIPNFTVQVNTLGCKECRPKHREALLTYLKTREAELTEESRQRMLKNPLRVLDSKVDGPKLSDAPSMKDFLCQACSEHYAFFLKYVRRDGVKIEENQRLVRGLDYYSRSVFEFVSADLGAQSALAAGGRYDDLVSMLGGPVTPAVGFALGMDRLVAVHQKVGAKSVKNEFKGTAVVIPMLDEAAEQAFTLAQNLREKGVRVPPILVKKKLKNQISSAVDIRANWAILIGEDELKSKSVTVKDLEKRIQENIPVGDVVRTLGEKQIR